MIFEKMKLISVVISVILFQQSFAQTADYKQEKFCANLKKVFELGIHDNFESYDGTMVKQSPFLPVPGYSIKLDHFAVNYVDKDNRFVAKTNLNMDSLSALSKVEELKNVIEPCLDSSEWKMWSEFTVDDSSTVFFKESKVFEAVSNSLTLKLATTIVAKNVYSINLYVRRRR